MIIYTMTDFFQHYINTEIRIKEKKIAYTWQRANVLRSLIQIFWKGNLGDEGA